MELDDIWQNYRSRLRGYIAKRMPEEGGAVDDILQDVFLRVYRNLNTLKSEENLPAWLYRIASNAVADYYRSQKPSEELPEHIAAPEIERDYASELASCLAPLISHLPQNYSVPLLLSEIEGLPHKDVALRLGISLAGAKSRILRGREKLRRLLLDCCDIEIARGGIVDYKRRSGECGCDCG